MKIQAIQQNFYRNPYYGEKYITSPNALPCAEKASNKLIENNNVYIGDKETGSMEKAVMGTKLVNYLKGFKSALKAVATAAKVGYTANIAAPLDAACQALENPENLLADKTFVD